MADWLILLAVIGVGLFFTLRVRAERQRVELTQTVRYTVLAEGVPTDVADANGGWEELIARGASVTTATGTAQLGRVERVRVSPSLSATVRDGRVTLVEAPDRVDVYVTVRAEATVREGDGLRVGDIRIAAGSTGDFRLGAYLAGGARIVSVKVGEA